ncbi:uncharacterized protein LOC109605211 [Aethina tumida]|uniref:uncharacterized protein LOC109605211 n=1 Tax=Aethina tumida TaxID=116153 RepID=UPI00096B19C9|nr:uncharacterized protein LOC109605211 [Aethina tumida]
MFAYKLCVVLVALLGADGEHQHGGKILGRMVRQYLHAQPDDVRIGDGVHLVSRAGDDGRSLSDDGTVLGAVDSYLRSHELKIRLPELMPGDDLGRSFKMALDKVEGTGVENGTGRGKGGGGGGAGIGLMGLMMGKMLAALGIGGVGLLAMKALMVSALALMLSVVIGLKKLVHSGGDEGGHHVIHASAHGHHDYRRKREADGLAYRGWQGYKIR